MMKYKKIFAACLAALMLLLLAGCQLAREDAGESTSGDRLVGVFITTQYLDLFDMESYLNDNIEKISGGEITIDGENRQYQGRLYATLTTRTLTNEETGETTDIKEYVFDGIDGIAYFSATVPETEYEDGFITSGSDEAISDGHMALHYGDDEDKTTLEGIIYLSPDHAGNTHYINPVYQCSDGNVYATAGSGFNIDGVQNEGSVYSHTLEETTTITENGKTKSVSISIKISIALMFPTQQIAVLQMDEDNTVLARTEYIPGELPNMLAPEPDAQYIIVETHKQDRQRNTEVSRRLYGKGDETLETFFCRQDGVCVKQWTQLKWRNQ